MSDVILFLTSPKTKEREQMSLENLRQLSKLGKDIIILSTVPNINEEFFKLSKLVIFDFYNGMIDKGVYKKAKEYPIPYGGSYGSFFYCFYCSNHPTYLIYTHTHFLSVFRNTKNLIKIALAFQYENFFYVEDDHYFSDDGINKLSEYFIRMNNENLNAIYFGNTWEGICTSSVIHSYFWFGNCMYFNESILDRIPETQEELESTHPDSIDYETFLYYVFYLQTHNKQNVYFENIKNHGFSAVFGKDTKLNIIYSHDSIISDSRSTLLYEQTSDRLVLFINLENLKVDEDYITLEIHRNNTLFFWGKLSKSLKFYALNVDLKLNEKPDIRITFNSKLTKEYKSLTENDVRKNGQWL